ncbi:MAG: hypothetical protein K2V38_28500, partial [Gemmataceae bacterium]|nr:hypothetical protein [Gemmataceae bacterium]
DQLKSARLVAVNRDGGGGLVSVDAHPLVRAYFADRLRAEHAAGWREGHRRLYEHLRDITKEGNAPTLDRLQPLYQAVAHGCHAGLHKEALAEVYRDRILRGTGNDGFYSTSKLGAFATNLGAVADFFTAPWNRVARSLTVTDQAWLLHEAAFHLRALGRLTEALEPLRASLKMRIREENWTPAAISANA